MRSLTSKPFVPCTVMHLEKLWWIDRPSTNVACLYPPLYSTSPHRWKWTGYRPRCCWPMCFNSTWERWTEIQMAGACIPTGETGEKWWSRGDSCTQTLDLKHPSLQELLSRRSPEALLLALPCASWGRLSATRKAALRVSGSLWLAAGTQKLWAGGVSLAKWWHPGVCQTVLGETF